MFFIKTDNLLCLVAFPKRIGSEREVTKSKKKKMRYEQREHTSVLCRRVKMTPVYICTNFCIYKTAMNIMKMGAKAQGRARLKIKQYISLTNLRRALTNLNENKINIQPASLSSLYKNRCKRQYKKEKGTQPGTISINSSCWNSISHC